MDPQKIPMRIIHCSEHTSREPLIEDLRQNFCSHIEVYEGVAFGSVYGNTLSHIHLLQEMVDRGHEWFVVFEDDVEMVGDKEELWAFINAAPKPFDIFLLGANEYVNQFLYTPEYIITDRFWGTHAMLVSKKAAVAILDYYYSITLWKQRQPPDWIYNQAIKHNNLIVFGPRDRCEYFWQKPGVESTIEKKYIDHIQLYVPKPNMYRQ